MIKEQSDSVVKGKNPMAHILPSVSILFLMYLIINENMFFMHSRFLCLKQAVVVKCQIWIYFQVPVLLLQVLQKGIHTICYILESISNISHKISILFLI